MTDALNGGECAAVWRVGCRQTKTLLLRVVGKASDRYGGVRINFFQTAITDAAAPALAKLQALNALYLGFTEMTPAGIESLQDQLPNCEIFFQQY